MHVCVYSEHLLLNSFEYPKSSQHQNKVWIVSDDDEDEDDDDDDDDEGGKKTRFFI